MKDVDYLNLLAQELRFVLKSEQRKALELLLRGKDVFCDLTTGLFIRCLFMQRVNSSSSVQRPTVIVISPVQKRGIGRQHIPWVPETFLARFPVSVKSL